MRTLYRLHLLSRREGMVFYFVAVRTRDERESSQKMETKIDFFKAEFNLERFVSDLQY